MRPHSTKANRRCKKSERHVAVNSERVPLPTRPSLSLHPRKTIFCLYTTPRGEANNRAETKGSAKDGEQKRYADPAGLEDCSPPSAGARPAQGRGPGEFGRGTRGNNAFPRLPQHSAPASVSGVPVTARSPSPAPVATSGQAPRQLSIPGDCPVGGDALRSPAGPSPGGVVSSVGGFSCPPRQGCAGIAGSGNRGRDLQTRGRGP